MVAGMKNSDVKQRSYELLAFFQGLPKWKDVEQIINCLDQQDYKAWLVGGCVRDALLQKSPGDIDLATDAKPDVVESLFPKTSSVGKAFGTVVVCLNDKNYEVTSFRSDGVYKDSRHPETVTFGNPREDAQRRDFTCNALFFDVMEPALVDFVGGLLDIDRKLIRCVGVPDDRFSEDALRLLRAIRFASQLNWEIEENTLKAIKAKKDGIRFVSRERVRQELFKILCSRHSAKGLQLLESTELLKAFFGSDCGPLHPIALHGRLEARLATLVYYWPEIHRQGFLKKIGFSQKNIRYILSLVAYGQKNIKQMSLACLRELVANPCFEDLCCLLKGLEQQEVLDFLCGVKKKYPRLPAPFFSGDDLKCMGFESNKDLGDTLRDLREAQLGQQIRSKQEAFEFVSAKLKC